MAVNPAITGIGRFMRTTSGRGGQRAPPPPSAADTLKPLLHANLAKEVVGPHHFDMFEFNTDDPTADSLLAAVSEKCRDRTLLSHRPGVSKSGITAVLMVFASEQV